MSQQGTSRPIPPASERRPWVAPRVEDLPRLTALTLSPGGGIPGKCEPGGGGGSGSTCF